MSEFRYFKDEIKPVLGEVLTGPYEGVRFALFGRIQIEEYFIYRFVKKAARDSRKTYRNCKFKYVSWQDAIPFADKLTPELLATLKD